MSSCLTIIGSENYTDYDQFRSSESTTISPYPYSIPGIPIMSTSKIPSRESHREPLVNEGLSGAMTPNLTLHPNIISPTNVEQLTGVNSDSRLAGMRSQPPVSCVSMHGANIDQHPKTHLTPRILPDDGFSQTCESLKSITLGVDGPSFTKDHRGVGAPDTDSIRDNSEIRPRQRPKLVVQPKRPSQIIQQDWSLSRICQEAVPLGWESVFTEAVMELKQISELIDVEEKKTMVVPLKKHIFRALEVVPMSKVRVIIWGQDPYHQLLSYGEPRAVGLSFSVARSDTVPRSLINIYKEISDNISDFVIPTHGDLRYWSRQGVLLLNSSLTCRVNEPNSHAKYMIWLPFITHLIKGIETLRPNCIHLLWGKEAQKIKQYINNKGVILTASHPSPLSAERGFFGCKHFSQVNRILTDLGETPIDWNLP